MTFPCDTQLCVRFVDGRKWEVMHAIPWYDETRDWTVVVPAGFLTDFASIPRAVWPLLPKTGRTYTRPAVVHDWLYHAGAVDGEPITRGYADQALKHAMQEEGAPWALRHLIHRAVRVGGWQVWRKRRKQAGSDRAKEGEEGVTFRTDNT